MTRTRAAICAGVITAQGAFCGAALGQAYCALRDPARLIRAHYPESTSQRSIVRTVDEAARMAVGKALPFTLHFNELGRHTLYVALKDTEPLGLVHVRSEKSRWGLVEIAWGLDLDMKVTGFEFQRCRSKYRGEFESKPFQAQLRGKGFDEIRAMLTEDGSQLAPNRLTVATDANDLALAVIRSALKTIITTKTVWGQDIESLRLEKHASVFFEGFNTIAKVGTAYTPRVIRELNDANGGYSSAFQRESTMVYKVLDDQQEAIGVLLCTHWRAGHEQAKIWWGIDREERITGISSEDWPSKDVKSEFEQLTNRKIDDTVSCGTIVSLAASEARVLARHHVHEITLNAH